MKVLVIPGLTLPEVSETDLERIRIAAGADSEVVVTRQRDAADHAADAEVILGIVSEKLFHAAPKLRWVHAIASGVDMFLYPEFVNSKVVLTSEKGLVGEHPQAPHSESGDERHHRRGNPRQHPPPSTGPRGTHHCVVDAGWRVPGPLGLDQQDPVRARNEPRCRA